MERRRRVVVDYRRVNAALRKAIYFIRRCEDVKQELAGKLFYTTVDGLKGFNLLENTDYASQVLAVLSDLGCLLAKVLQLGPCNGPFDFQYVVDDLFSLGGGTPLLVRLLLEELSRRFRYPFGRVL